MLRDIKSLHLITQKALTTKNSINQNSNKNNYFTNSEKLLKNRANDLSYNVDNAKKLWKLSEELTGVSYSID